MPTDDTPPIIDLFPEIDIERFRDVIECPSMTPELDPDWQYVDRAGHGHFVARKADDSGSRLPTLRWEDDDPDDDFDPAVDYMEGHWGCPLCGEDITPGTRMPDTKYIPGPTTTYVTMTWPPDRGHHRTTKYDIGPDDVTLVRRAVANAIHAQLDHRVVSDTSVYRSG